MVRCGDELRNAISSFAEIAWARCGPVLSDPQVDQFHITHMTVWRYTEPQPQLEQWIKDAVESFEGHVAWQMIAYGRNWIIAPAQHDITNLEKRAQHPNTEIGRASNTDLIHLAAHIHAYVQSRIDP